MSKATVSVGIGFSLALVLVLLGLVWIFGGESSYRSERNASSSTAVGEDAPTTSGADGTRPGSVSSGPSETAKDPALETLDELRRSVPPGIAGGPEGYALAQFPSGRAPKPRWLIDIVRDLCGVDLFSEPPYASRWMFGDSDRAWLERLHKSFKAAVQNDVSATVGTESLNDRQREQIESRVRSRYRDLLWSTAQARLRSNPELAARFDDQRSLKELNAKLPSGKYDSQYYWLSELLDSLVPGQLFEVGLNDSQDTPYLSATDLPEIVQLRFDISRAYRRGDEDRLVTKEESIQVHRSFAERLQAILNAKKPAGKGE